MCLIVMATDRETLSIVQFLRLIDRDGIGQPQLVVHDEFDIFPRQGQSTRQHGLIRPSDREKLGQSAIGIALYPGPMDSFLDLTNSLPV